MRKKLQRLALATGVMLLVVLGMDACDPPKDTCKRRASTWSYVPTFTGRTTTITPVYSSTCLDG